MVQNPDKSVRQLIRRAFIIAGSAAAAVAYSLRRGTAPVEEREVSERGVAILPVILKTDVEWKQQLSPEAFEVTRHAGT
jgi:peptide-methionine (R)-S-oxide reductase